MLTDRRNLTVHVPIPDYLVLQREAARRKVTFQVLLAEIVRSEVERLRERQDVEE